jgi:hypothetical protein
MFNKARAPIFNEARGPPGHELLTHAVLDYVHLLPRYR